MHYTCKNSALAVSIGHFVPYISDRLVAPGRNITMASQARQLLLDSEDIMDSYCNDSDSEYESEHSDIESENKTVHVSTEARGDAGVNFQSRWRVDNCSFSVADSQFKPLENVGLKNIPNSITNDSSSVDFLSLFWDDSVFWYDFLKRFKSYRHS